MNTQVFWVLLFAAALGNSNADRNVCPRRDRPRPGVLPRSEPCKEGEGVCRRDWDCEGSLVCGTNNCRDFPHNGIRDSRMNCCRKPANWDWNFCSADSPCGLGEGDCDGYEECNAADRLECGKNNCRDFDSNFDFDSVSNGKDCCRESVLFDWHYCSTLHLCGAGEGDCDSDDECSGDLVCGKDNCKDFGDSADSTKDCCKEVEEENSDDSGTGGCGPGGCAGDDTGDIGDNTK